MKKNIIQDKSFDFALQVIGLYQWLVDNREYILSKQVLRSGTSIGACVEEGLAAESRKDFVHKMSIAAKEARETRYWLRLLQRSQLVPMDYTTYLNEINHITRLLTRIVKSTKEG